MPVSVHPQPWARLELVPCPPPGLSPWFPQGRLGLRQRQGSGPRFAVRPLRSRALVLVRGAALAQGAPACARPVLEQPVAGPCAAACLLVGFEIGRASCREGV